MTLILALNTGKELIFHYDLAYTYARNTIKCAHKTKVTKTPQGITIFGHSGEIQTNLLRNLCNYAQKHSCQKTQETLANLSSNSTKTRNYTKTESKFRRNTILDFRRNRIIYGTFRGDSPILIPFNDPEYQNNTEYQTIATGCANFDFVKKELAKMRSKSLERTVCRISSLLDLAAQVHTKEYGQNVFKGKGLRILTPTYQYSEFKPAAKYEQFEL